MEMSKHTSPMHKNVMLHYNAAMSRLLLLAVVALVLAACGSGGDRVVVTATPQVDIGAGASIDDVRYVASERVTSERLPRDRLEEAGEARLDKIVRRVTAYRLKENPKAALRYTVDGANGWIAWQPLVVLSARRELARAVNAPASAIQTADITHETWTDNCLNTAKKDSSCSTAAIPGFKVVLRFNGKTYEYHTDRNERAEPAQ